MRAAWGLVVGMTMGVTVGAGLALTPWSSLAQTLPATGSADPTPGATAPRLVGTGIAIGAGAGSGHETGVRPGTPLTATPLAATTATPPAIPEAGQGPDRRAGADQEEAAEEGEARRSVFTYGLDLSGGRNLALVPGASGSGTELRADLAWALDWRTRRSTLAFDARVAPLLRGGNGGNGGGGFAGTYPALHLRFDHAPTRDHALHLEVSRVTTEISDQSLDPRDTGRVLSYEGRGDRHLTRAMLGFEGGLGHPFSYRLRHDHTAITHDGLQEGLQQGGLADSPGRQRDTRTGDTGLGLSLALGPAAVLSLDHDHTRHEILRDLAGRDTTRRTDRSTLGLGLRLDAITRAQLSVAQTRIDIDRPGAVPGLQDHRVSGTGLGFLLEREERRGAARLSYDRSVFESGTRDSLRLARERRSRTGALRGALGLSRGEDGDSALIGELSYRLDLAQDQVQFDLSRAVQDDSFGRDVLVTRLSGGLRHGLSGADALDFGLAASWHDVTGPGAGPGTGSGLGLGRDERRLDAHLAWLRAGRDGTQLMAGVRLGLSQADARTNARTNGAADEARSAALFMRLTRRLEVLH